jgi:uncharacterized protein YbjT (DUF2867 family)
MQHRVFVTGGTGYVGSRLIPLLRARGHHITALVRRSSQGKAPSNCEVVLGDALDGDSYKAFLGSADTLVHLVGVAHPGPSKAREFVEIDQRSALEAVRVARETGIRHFVYVSVAHPAPVMKAYIEVRKRCEQAIADAGLNATILRPWYVLGPAHRWPLALAPLYRAAELIPHTRAGALRLGLVTIKQMVNTLASVIEHPASGITTLGVPDIRALCA